MRVPGEGKGEEIQCLCCKVVEGEEKKGCGGAFLEQCALSRKRRSRIMVARGGVVWSAASQTPTRPAIPRAWPPLAHAFLNLGGLKVTSRTPRPSNPDLFITQSIGSVVTKVIG